jgi:hypothetical protein
MNKISIYDIIIDEWKYWVYYFQKYFDKLKSKHDKQISLLLIYVIQLYKILIDNNMEVNEEK